MSHKTRDAGEKRRVQTVLLRAKGWVYAEIAQALGCAPITVGRVLKRWQKSGEAGLIDRREDNGLVKVDDEFLECLTGLLSRTPRDYRWSRSTWTIELLILTMKRITGVKVSTATMSGTLKNIGARRRRPRSIVACPWPVWKQQKRLKELKNLIEKCPSDEIVLYEDEVDIHLNPKIGYDWMLPGCQKTVLTPGQNQKRYLAGALDARRKEITVVEGRSKNSDLFIRLCLRLIEKYPRVKVIHLILDNYKIHDSKQTKQLLESLNGRIKLHFLPPYYPQANRIERRWQDLHANVTRNHTYKTIQGLMMGVRAYLRRFERGVEAKVKKPAA
jgi:transposase